MYEFLQIVISSHTHVHHHIKEKKMVYYSIFQDIECLQDLQYWQAPFSANSDLAFMGKKGAKYATVNEDKPFDTSSNRYS